MSHDSLYNQIVEELAGDGITGWCPVEKALDLASIIVAIRPKVIMETGVWGGRSFLPMALACEAVGQGTVIGIDPWNARASAEGYAGQNVTWWQAQDHDRIYRDFIDNVGRLGLRTRTVIHRMKSDDAPLPDTIDLAHLDSQHTEQVIREVKRFGSRVRIGGFVVLDDLSWTNEGDQPVQRAVELLTGMGFTEIQRTKQANGEWGVFQKTGIAFGEPVVTNMWKKRRSK